MIKVKETSIKGLFIIEPSIIEDSRGYFFESYNDIALAKYGLKTVFVQDNESVSKKNVLRGMHVNIEYPQSKIIRVIDGSILDVVIDLRKDSISYMSCFSVVLSSDNKQQLFIPEGIGHGYLALSDSRVLMKTTTHYMPNSELCFSWRSKQIIHFWNIDNPIQNDRDMNSKLLSEVWN